MASDVTIPFDEQKAADAGIGAETGRAGRSLASGGFLTASANISGARSPPRLIGLRTSYRIELRKRGGGIVILRDCDDTRCQHTRGGRELRQHTVEMRERAGLAAWAAA